MENLLEHEGVAGGVIMSPRPFANLDRLAIHHPSFELIRIRTTTDGATGPWHVKCVGSEHAVRSLTKTRFRIDPVLNPMQTSSAATAAPQFRDDNNAVVEVRPMGLSDLPFVLEIQAACYTRIVPESLESFVAKLMAAPASCFIAAIERRTVGYLVALPWDFANPPMLDQTSCRLPKSPDCLHLHDLAVAPTARAAGAGRRLVDAFFAHLQQSELPRASLIAIQDSAPYWQRHGFSLVQPADSLQAKLASYGQDVQYMQFSKKAMAL